MSWLCSFLNRQNSYPSAGELSVLQELMSSFINNITNWAEKQFQTSISLRRRNRRRRLVGSGVGGDKKQIRKWGGNTSNSLTPLIYPYQSCPDFTSFPQLTFWVPTLKDSFINKVFSFPSPWNIHWEMEENLFGKTRLDKCKDLSYWYCLLNSGRIKTLPQTVAWSHNKLRVSNLPWALNTHSNLSCVPYTILLSAFLLCNNFITSA